MDPLAPIAQFGQSDEWMAVVLGGLMLLIPIIWILTRHQQNMAKILREQHNSSSQSEIEALRSEMARLTQAVHQQTIAMDSLTRQNSTSTPARFSSEPPPQTQESR